MPGTSFNAIFSKVKGFPVCVTLAVLHHKERLMSEVTDELLRHLISPVSRTVFDEERLRQIVGPPGTSAKQFVAYNLCDGTRTQGEVAKQAKIDAGNFSRTLARWVEAGVVFCIGEGRDANVRHVYPLPAQLAKTQKQKKKRKP